MQVLLTGSTGLIGSAVAARLLAEGHEVTGVGRRGGPQPGMRWITLDIRSASRPDDWLPLLKGSTPSSIASVYCKTAPST